MSHCLNKNFLFAVMAIAFGSGFQHGYHTGILNVPSQIIRNWTVHIKTLRTHEHRKPILLEETRILWTMIVATYPLGGLTGSLLVGYFAERCGRKKTILASSIISFVAATLMAFAKTFNSFEMFIFGRFLAGIYAGLSGGLCQIFLSEISPDEIRGAVGSFYQVVICFSLLVCPMCGWLVTAKTWPFLFVVPLVPLLFQVATLPFVPESPKYLFLGKEKEEKAEEALCWYKMKEDVEEEIDLLKEEDNLVKRLQLITVIKLFTKPRLKQLLLNCLTINAAQQLCGVNVIIYYSFIIVKDVGYLLTFFVTILVGITLLVCSIIVMFLIDKVGRKPLLIVSQIGSGASCLLLGYTLIFLNKDTSSIFTKCFAYVCIFVFIATFSMGLGPIPWFLTAEVFNYKARSSAVSIVVAANWFFNFLVGQLFVALKDAIGYYTFLIFVILDVFFYAYTTLYIKETKKMSAIEIINLFN